MIDPILIERFALLFAGLTRAKGRYVSLTDPSQLVVGDKSKGKATTITEAVTLDDYRRHLEGELGLGIVPIRDDGTCVFGAIDVDQYAGLDHQGIVQAIAALKIPAFVCRSKSGGAHIYVFILEPGIKAGVLIEYLRNLRSTLGIDRRKAREIFPKQAKQAGGIGNWINLPYFGDSLRRTVKADGTYMSLEEFLNTVQRVESSALSQGAADDNLIAAELPPCLERLVQDGIPAGMRNDALYNFTVFAAKKFQLDRPKTVKLLDVINMRVCQPPVSSNELRTTLDSVLKHEYNYKCDQSPLVEVCDKIKCAMRPFGPSASMRPGDIPEIEKIEIRGEEADETKYYVKLVASPRVVVCDSKTLNDYETFRRAVQDTTHVRLPEVKKKVWDAYLTARWDAFSESIRSSAERTKKGSIAMALEDWIKTNATNDPERYALGRPYIEGNIVHIGVNDFVARLKQVQWRIELPAVVAFLEDNGWEKVARSIGNRAHDNVWMKPLDGDQPKVREENVQVKEVNGQVVVEVPKDLPAEVLSDLEEFEDFSQFHNEESQ